MSVADAMNEPDDREQDQVARRAQQAADRMRLARRILVGQARRMVR